MNIFDKMKTAFMGPVANEEMEEASQQPQQDLELAGYVKNKIEDCRGQAARVANEGIWMTNIAYLLGFDSVYYDTTARQFRQVAPNNSGNYLRRNRTRENILLPAAQNRLARMLKNPPKYDVRPNEMTEEDKEAARLGIEVIDGVWDKQKINRKRIDLGMWTQQCGHAYVGISFDDQLGEELRDPDTNEVLGYEGEVRVDVASAFECFADPLAKTFEESSWFARAKVRKLDYFRTHYDRGQLVKEEGVWLLSQQYEMRINTLNAATASNSGTAEQMKGSAVEISYYEKRSQKYPNGRHIIVANGVLLKNTELQVGEIPYAKFDDIIVAGKYYSETPITHARPLQDQYNVSLTKRAEWVRKVLAGKYIAAKGHGLIQEAINDQSGEVVEYDPVPNAKEPHAMEIPTMPQYIYTECADIKKSIYDLFGLSEVSRGQLPSASIPGVGINLLLEQDETRIGIEVEAHEHSWARVGALILKFADKYYITDRKLKTKGKNLEYNIKTFNGAMLRKNFDVTVIRGSTVPNSKVLKRQEITNLYQMGLYGSPTDPTVIQKVLGDLEYGDTADAWKEFHLVKGQINRTIKMMEQGIAPVVDKKDNHPMHLAEKNNYRLAEKWDTLPPLVQALFEQDMETHLNFLVEQSNPQLAVPPDPGPPPPPPGMVAPPVMN